MLKWAEEKQAAFKNALMGGHLKSMIAGWGGTGELREPLTHKERVKRKRNKQIARASRQRNRR